MSLLYIYKYVLFIYKFVYTERRIEGAVCDCLENGGEEEELRELAPLLYKWKEEEWKLEKKKKQEN